MKGQPTSGQSKQQSLISQLGAPIVVGLLILVLTIFSVKTGYEMKTMIVVLAVGWISILAILWCSSTSRWLSIAASVFSTVILVVAVWWEYKNDRPIIQPQITRLVLQSALGKGLNVNPEVAITNKGKQPGNADSWKLSLIINGSRVEGVETFGQPSPPVGGSESDISSQDFPVGKPVRGWLFFSFATISNEYAESNFICGSPALDKILLQIAVSDSKEHEELKQTKSLKELGADGCLEPVVKPRVIPAFQTKKIHKPAKPAATITTINAPNGIGISGGTVFNPTVNNGPPKPKIEGWSIVSSDSANDGRGHPITTYKFSLSSMPISQRFLGACDRPCTESWALAYPMPNQVSSGDWSLLSWPQKQSNNVGWEINVHMEAHQEFTVSVVSGDDQPVKIIQFNQP